MFLQVHVQGRAAREVLDVFAAVQSELVHDVERFVLDDVKIAVVTVAPHLVAVALVPFGMFHSHVLRRNHLAVEHHLLRAVLLVVLFDHSENFLRKTFVIGIVVDRNAEKFGRFDQSVHTDSEVLARHIDIARIEQGQHPLRLHVFQVLVVGQLHLVHQIDHLLEEELIGHTLTCGVLDATVQVDRQHALRAGRYASGAERVAEPVVRNFVAQAAAARKRIGIVAHVGKERMSLGIHFGREIAPLLVLHVTVFRE